jgi:7-cyano-7-deazaguanosine (preQ0) biosynthesis protein QueE
VLRLSRLASGEPEIFCSVQGEGISLGLPSVFVRLSLCNLRCSWCDTQYTWNWAQYDPKVEIIDLPIDDVLGRVQASGVRNVVITGGEPLQQQRELTPLATALKDAGHRLEVETNGTFVPNAELAAAIDQWNVSPKLANSENPIEQRRVTRALAWFAAEARAVFKFVIVEPGDLTEVDELVTRFGLPPERVLLMPEGRSSTGLQERSRWLVDQACQRGYRFTPRLHVLLWGDERGR